MADVVTVNVGAAKKTTAREGAAKAAAGTSLIVITVLSILCLVGGVGILVVPASFVTFGEVVPPAVPGVNPECTVITPATTPYAPSPVSDDRLAFIAAWEEYEAALYARPEGVRVGCEPMRFPATGPYKGVVVIWHGFSSCPQEMAKMGPPLAAHGYDVVFPLMAGHGNALRYIPDAPNYLWGYLTMGISLLLLSICGLACCCPFAKPCEPLCACCDDAKDGCCGDTGRKRCIGASCWLLTILFFVSLFAVMTAIYGADADSVFCLSLSFEDGVGPGCGGFAESNDNLPTSAAGYEREIDAMAELVKLAPGEKALMGLSGGGAAALYMGMTAKNADGTALFSRQLLVAPYLDVAIIGAYLDNIIALGLGEVQVDFGEKGCRDRRDMGKRGYCNYKFNRITGMKEVGQNALANLAILPGASVEVVLSQFDGTITNADISVLTDKLSALADGQSDATASDCILTHVDSRHSPLSLWNYIHQVGDESMPWVPELVCQFTAFLDAGTPLPVDGTAQTAELVSHDQCATECRTPGDCAYSCVDDAFLQCGA